MGPPVAGARRWAVEPGSTADPPAFDRESEPGAPWQATGQSLSEFLLHMIVFEAIWTAQHQLCGLVGVGVAVFGRDVVLHYPHGDAGDAGGVGVRPPAQPRWYVAWSGPGRTCQATARRCRRETQR